MMDEQENVSMNPPFPKSHGLARARFYQNICGASLVMTLAAVPLWGQKTAQVQVNMKKELAVVPAAGYGVGMSV
jgi:hypothetical protein